MLDPVAARGGPRGMLGLQIPLGSSPKDPKSFLYIGIFVPFIPEFGSSSQIVVTLYVFSIGQPQ